MAQQTINIADKTTLDKVASTTKAIQSKTNAIDTATKDIQSKVDTINSNTNSLGGLDGKLGSPSDSGDTTVFGKENAIKDRLFKGFVPYTYYKQTQCIEKTITVNSEVSNSYKNTSKVIGSFSFDQFDTYMISLCLEKPNSGMDCSFFISSSDKPITYSQIETDPNVIFYKLDNTDGNTKGKIFITPFNILEKTKNIGLKKNVVYYVHLSGKQAYNYWYPQIKLTVRAYSFTKTTDENIILTTGTKTKISFAYEYIADASHLTKFFNESSVVFPVSYPVDKLIFSHLKSGEKKLIMSINGESVCIGVWLNYWDTISGTCDLYA